MVAQLIPEAHITAVEISPAMITVAKEQVESEGLTDRIEFVVGSARDGDQEPLARRRARRYVADPRFEKGVATFVDT